VLADFFPEKYPEFGQDPHCVVLSPADPDRLYQQNHIGVYRSDNHGDTWDRIDKARALIESKDQPAAKDIKGFIS